MSHPFNSIRNDKVQKSRVASIAKGRAAGGSISANVAGPKKLTSAKVGGLDVEGAKAKYRPDRHVMRKDGGRVKTPTVNVTINTAPKDDKLALPPMPMPPPGAMAPPPGPPGPMAGGPPPGAGMPPPEMMPRKAGGRVSGPAWNEGLKNGTKVQHAPGKNDKKDMNRKRVVTFNTGGGVVSFRADGGKVEAPQGVAAATKLPGGAGGGKGRLAKAAKYGGK